MPILLIIVSKLIHQMEGVFIKKYDSKHSKGGFIFTSIVSLFSMLVFLLMDLFMDSNGLEFSKGLIVYGILAGICFCTASLFTYIALGSGSFVLSQLILSYGILITVVHGLFLGEKFSVWGWIGLVLISLSLYFVKGNEKQEGVKITKGWVFSILISVVFAGLFGILQRQQQRTFKNRFDNEFMIISLAVSGFVLLIIGIVKDRKDLKYIFKYGSPYAIGAGVSNGLTNLLTLYLYTIAPMSFVAPTSAGVAMLISFLISKFIFREKFSKMQYLGVILGGIAIVLFNL